MAFPVGLPQQIPGVSAQANLQVPALQTKTPLQHWESSVQEAPSLEQAGSGSSQSVNAVALPEQHMFPAAVVLVPAPRQVQKPAGHIPEMQLLASSAVHAAPFGREGAWHFSEVQMWDWQSVLAEQSPPFGCGPHVPSMQMVLLQSAAVVQGWLSAWPHPRSIVVQGWLFGWPHPRSSVQMPERQSICRAHAMPFATGPQAWAPGNLVFVALLQICDAHSWSRPHGLPVGCRPQTPWVRLVSAHISSLPQTQMDTHSALRVHVAPSGCLPQS